MRSRRTVSGKPSDMIPMPQKLRLTPVPRLLVSIPLKHRKVWIVSMLPSHFLCLWICGLVFEKVIQEYFNGGTYLSSLLRVGLFALAKKTSAIAGADERGSCTKCDGFGHFAYQCRSFIKVTEGIVTCYFSCKQSLSYG